jgi:hypothetical protein
VRSELRDEVLDRLGIGSDSDLASVYAAWCAHVPWDSAQKRLYFSGGRAGPLPGSSTDEFFDTWLRHGCGGTCWAGSLALHALLVALGFDARVGAGQVQHPGDPLYPLPNHATVLVRGEDAGNVGDVIVDSSFLTVDPVPLPELERDRTFRFRAFRPESGEEWRLLLTDVPLELAAAWHEATRDGSKFNRLLAVRRNRGGDVVGWNWGEARRIRADGSVEVVDVDRTTWLVEQVGFSEELASSLPADELVHAA